MRQSGFTIVEVMIVLAISSALAVFIIAGSGRTVNQQRYQDAVMTLLGDLQQEYIATTRVVNGARTATQFTCDASATVTEGAGAPRGTSDCVLIGRVINFTNGGRTMTTYDVVGREKTPGAAPAQSTIASLKSYYLKRLDATASVSDLAWETAVYDPSNPTNVNGVGIVLLRSPISGATVTFVRHNGVIANAQLDTTDGSTTSIISTTNMTEQTLCVNSNGLSSQPVNGVFINAGASGPNGVTQKQGGNGC